MNFYVHIYILEKSKKTSEFSVVQNFFQNICDMLCIYFKLTEEEGNFSGINIQMLAVRIYYTLYMNINCHIFFHISSTSGGTIVKDMRIYGMTKTALLNIKLKLLFEDKVFTEKKTE